ncbi:MAG: orotate phosphoribosyltransferase [bacterium]|nr:orotate phosphoribosyltransferase [bacterium]
MSTAEQVAKALLDIGAVGFSLDNPVTFKSGIKSPVYVDNRRLTYWPQQWKIVITAFQEKAAVLHFDVIAGVETAGIPHSAALAFALDYPSVFIRKQPKEHGLKNRIEGGEVSGRRVLLIEDLVTTGGSSLAGVEALREAGASASDCLAIVSYGFVEADAAFQQAAVRLHTLTDFATIARNAYEMQRISQSDMNAIKDWMEDPHGWAAKHGLA